MVSMALDRGNLIHGLTEEEGIAMPIERKAGQNP